MFYMICINRSMHYTTVRQIKRAVITFSVEIHCGSLSPPSNGIMTGNNEVVDSVLIFSCDYGFRLSGSTQRICMDIGDWNGTDVFCDDE